ncbi:hypothetical protein QSE00_03125 [Arenibacter sp. M-2]|uniref:hypothetical protein n=1 Tax=unclassified Arenibacter TaxID=2615047 RepID=UPI000D75FABA|nr:MULTISPECIES: hypothetical protein [unclassified Arenibacter]MDL5510794.1 hypothetical protein [Arenibacter sp. M-2]PXX26861.1 hypothetical protein C7972_108155 [Arenibacter sp. ARW7G5Y1]|tara:strand:- start:11972 stop:12334 length:363 start_codon:yes stop_codon:yes gene_type:complete
MKRLALLFLIVTVFIGCTDRDDDLEGVNIRIKNESSVTFDTVQVGSDDMIHENIAPEEYSGYLEYETAYSYAYINIMVAGETYVLQPIDFVGETPLENGFYTYVLNLSEEGDVILSFMED